MEETAGDIKTVNRKALSYEMDADEFENIKEDDNKVKAAYTKHVRE